MNAVKKDLWQKILILLLVAAVFVGLDAWIYLNFTRRCVNNTSPGMQAKSVELDKYLPFAAESDVVKRKSALTLSGDIPVIDSAAALYPVISAFVHAVYPEDGVFFDGKDFTPESALQMKNTTGCYKRVVDGEDDVIIVSGIGAEQQAYADEKGVELCFVPIGREGFVFLVNDKNPVEGLTQQQIRDIYAGKITRWSEVGGPGRFIDPLTRNVGSGSQSRMLRFMGDAPIKKNIFAFAGLAIGYSFRYYVNDVVENGAVKMLSVDGVYPSSENIANGTYPLVGTFYAVYRADNENPNIPLLLEWILSDEGQQIIEETGYARLKQED